VLSIQSLLEDEQGYTLSLGRYQVLSVFQPIYELNQHTLIGHEALLRCTDAGGESISPEQLFNSNLSRLTRIKMDLIAATLHAINYRKYKDKISGKLFINFNPASIAYLHRHPRVWQTMFNCVQQNDASNSRYDFSNLVIEVVEQVSDSRIPLEQQLAQLRSHGCLLAIDDFGSGNSDLPRVQQVNPQIVKLDKSILRQLRNHPVQSLPNIKESFMLHGRMIVMEGVEMSSDLQIAKQVGAEWGQGYYLGKPTRNFGLSTIR
jgi:EAL domain-containing protein (putative c-di-GMP-specific phosphodiesterase class I)